MTSGGKRSGAGRPIGTKKESTVVYYRRVKPAWIIKLDEYLENLKHNKEQE